MAKGRDWNKVGEIVAKVRELGPSYKHGAKRFGVKPWLLYDYNKKTKHEAREAAGTATKEKPFDGGDTEVGKSTGENPVGLPGDVGDLICTYRREHPSHGFKRIQDILKGKYLVVVSRKQIRKVLKDAGLLEACDSSFDVEEVSAKGTRRFEAQHPGELWQMDVTYVFIHKIPVLYLVIIIDDYSRYCVAAELSRDQRVETLIGVLHSACTLHGAPQKLHDPVRGPCWFLPTSRCHPTGAPFLRSRAWEFPNPLPFCRQHDMIRPDPAKKSRNRSCRQSWQVQKSHNPG